MSRHTFTQLLHLLVKSIAEDRGGAPELPEDREHLHRTFKQLVASHQQQFPALRELQFIEEGAFPYSPELTEALDRLQMSGAITRQNPSYERFSPTEYGDTTDVVKRELALLVGQSPAKKRAFDQLVRTLSKQLK